MHIIYGLLIAAAGVSIIVYTESILNSVGRIEFFEAHMGSFGGSRLGYKLIGIIITFIGVMTLTGLMDNFMLWFLSPLLMHQQPVQTN
jgi:hypothetical protein